jgi:predicted MFS family arabinose efflux permease
VAIWGLGFAASNSMQQVRLVGADPGLASATVSLNSSMLYIGQAIGSATGGALFAAGEWVAAGYAAIGFIVVSIATAVLTAPRARIAD